jgi:hypothetical protein
MMLMLREKFTVLQVLGRSAGRANFGSVRSHVGRAPSFPDCWREAAGQSEICDNTGRVTGYPRPGDAVSGYDLVPRCGSQRM